MEGRSTTLAINLVSPPSTTSIVEELQLRALLNWSGALGAAMGAEPVSAPNPKIQPPTVVHESLQYIVVQECKPPPRNPTLLVLSAFLRHPARGLTSST